MALAPMAISFRAMPLRGKWLIEDGVSVMILRLPTHHKTSISKQNFAVPVVNSIAVGQVVQAYWTAML